MGSGGKQGGKNLPPEVASGTFRDIRFENATSFVKNPPIILEAHLRLGRNRKTQFGAFGAFLRLQFLQNRRHLVWLSSLVFGSESSADRSDLDENRGLLSTTTTFVGLMRTGYFSTPLG